MLEHQCKLILFQSSNTSSRALPKWRFDKPNWRKGIYAPAFRALGTADDFRNPEVLPK